ncbi:MAG: hypothetical protein H0T46_34975 [Deltaproteobacteria bacterium]|nr:hypothetical protein [Deltaproteobacteria bacterium]
MEAPPPVRVGGTFRLSDPPRVITAEQRAFVGTAEGYFSKLLETLFLTFVFPVFIVGIIFANYESSADSRGNKVGGCLVGIVTLSMAFLCLAGPSLWPAHVTPTWRWVFLSIVSVMFVVALVINGFRVSGAAKRVEHRLRLLAEGRVVDARALRPGFVTIGERELFIEASDTLRAQLVSEATLPVLFLEGVDEVIAAADVP